jgi:predicted kinase
MEAILLIGLQASGKSTFYRERFFTTHVHVSLDVLKTRHRENRFIALCVETRQRFVLDDTNATGKVRRGCIHTARGAGFRVVGYYFQSKVAECLQRNEQRPEGQRVPDKGILGTLARMELPALDEGFDELYYVRIDQDTRFVVEEWNDEDR